MTALVTFFLGALDSYGRFYHRDLTGLFVVGTLPVDMRRLGSALAEHQVVLLLL